MVRTFSRFLARFVWKSSHCRSSRLNIDDGAKVCACRRGRRGDVGYWKVEGVGLRGGLSSYGVALGRPGARHASRTWQRSCSCRGYRGCHVGGQVGVVVTLRARKAATAVLRLCGLNGLLPGRVLRFPASSSRAGDAATYRYRNGAGCERSK